MPSPAPGGEAARPALVLVRVRVRVRASGHGPGSVSASPEPEPDGEAAEGDGATLVALSVSAAAPLRDVRDRAADAVASLAGGGAAAAAADAAAADAGSARGGWGLRLALGARSAGGAPEPSPAPELELELELDARVEDVVRRLGWSAEDVAERELQLELVRVAAAPGGHSGGAERERTSPARTALGLVGALGPRVPSLAYTDPTWFARAGSASTPSSPGPASRRASSLGDARSEAKRAPQAWDGGGAADRATAAPAPTPTPMAAPAPAPAPARSPARSGLDAAPSSGEPPAKVEVLLLRIGILGSTAAPERCWAGTVGDLARAGALPGRPPPALLFRKSRLDALPASTALGDAGLRPGSVVLADYALDLVGGPVTDALRAARFEGLEARLKFEVQAHMDAIDAILGAVRRATKPDAAGRALDAAGRPLGSSLAAALPASHPRARARDRFQDRDRDRDAGAGSGAGAGAGAAGGWVARGREARRARRRRPAAQGGGGPHANANAAAAAMGAGEGMARWRVDDGAGAGGDGGGAAQRGPGPGPAPDARAPRAVLWRRGVAGAGAPGEGGAGGVAAPVARAVRLVVDVRLIVQLSIFTMLVGLDSPQFPYVVAFCVCYYVLAVGLIPERVLARLTLGNVGRIPPAEAEGFLLDAYSFVASFVLSVFPAWRVRPVEPEQGPRAAGAAAGVGAPAQAGVADAGAGAGVGAGPVAGAGAGGRGGAA